MKIRDVMTANPVSCATDATLQEIARKMDQVDTGIMPLTEGDRPVAVITDRDIAIRAVADGADPKTARAIDYATRDVTCVSPDMGVDEAIEKMEQGQIRRLLVLDQNRLAGVVSLGDLAETTKRDAKEVLVDVSKSEKTLAHKPQR